MNEEEAIKDLEKMKSIEYNPKAKSEVIETVLNLLKKKDKIIDLMAKCIDTELSS